MAANEEPQKYNTLNKRKSAWIIGMSIAGGIAGFGLAYWACLDDSIRINRYYGPIAQYFLGPIVPCCWASLPSAFLGGLITAANYDRVASVGKRITRLIHGSDSLTRSNAKTIEDKVT